MTKKIRQLRKDEEDDYEWIEVQEAGQDFPIRIRGLKKTEPPPMPDDGFLYVLKEITKYSDAERRYEWVPVMTYEDD